MEVNTYDKELVDRAKHRGRAYLCLACHYTKKVRYIEEHGKMEDHILRHHIEADRIPFFCSLCKFKCLKKDQFVRHLSHYARHVSMAAARKVVDHSPWMVESPNPYPVGEMDMVKLSQEESLRFFLERSTQRQSPLINAGLTKLQCGNLEADINEETLRTGVISAPAAVTQMPAPTTVPPVGQTQMLGAPVYWYPQQQGLFAQIQQWLANTTGGSLQGPVSSALPIQPSTIQPVAAQQQQFQTQQPGTLLLAPSPGHQATIISTGLDTASSTGYVEAYVPEEPVDDEPGQPDIEDPVHRAEEPVEAKKSETSTTAGDDDEDNQEAGVANPTAVADPTEVVEDITSQLLGAEEQNLNSPVVEPKKRKINTGAEAVASGSSDDKEATTEETVSKRRKVEEGTEEVNISLVAMNSLVTTLQSLKGQMGRNEKASDKVDRALTDMAAQMSQVTDALHRWKEVINDSVREEKVREERRIEADRRREEAKRKEQEAEVKRADKRREDDRKDRQEMRALMTELREWLKEKKKSEARTETTDRRGSTLTDSRQRAEDSRDRGNRRGRTTRAEESHGSRGREREEERRGRSRDRSGSSSNSGRDNRRVRLRRDEGRDAEESSSKTEDEKERKKDTNAVRGDQGDRKDSNKKDDEKENVAREDEKDRNKEDDEERETGWDRRERFDSTNTRRETGDLREKLKRGDKREEDDKKAQGDKQEKQVKSIFGKTNSENKIKDCGK